MAKKFRLFKSILSLRLMEEAQSLKVGDYTPTRTDLQIFVEKYFERLLHLDLEHFLKAAPKGELEETRAFVLENLRTKPVAASREDPGYKEFLEVWHAFWGWMDEVRSLHAMEPRRESIQTLEEDPEWQKLRRVADELEAKPLLEILETRSMAFISCVARALHAYHRVSPSTTPPSRQTKKKSRDENVAMREGIVKATHESNQNMLGKGLDILTCEELDRKRIPVLDEWRTVHKVKSWVQALETLPGRVRKMFSRDRREKDTSRVTL